jgi:hypothetical protein
MDIQDSTNHGWGFEIGAVLEEAESKERWDECCALISVAVAAYCEEQSGEDMMDDEEGRCFVFAITDCITNLHPLYLPLLKRMDAISRESRSIRKRCHSDMEALPPGEA